MTYATPRHIALALLAAGIILASACTKKMSREAAPNSSMTAVSETKDKKGAMKLAVATKIPRKKRMGREGRMGSRSRPKPSGATGGM